MDILFMSKNEKSKIEFAKKNEKTCLQHNAAKTDFHLNGL
jgi:hypothetical protein